LALLGHPILLDFAFDALHLELGLADGEFYIHLEL